MGEVAVPHPPPGIGLNDSKKGVTFTEVLDYKSTLLFYRVEG